jgi:hypothetical protein
MTLLASLAILVGGILITGALIFIVGRFVPKELRGHEERRGWVFAFCGVLYALVIGFVLAFALEGYQGAESDAGIEAESVTALSREATLFNADSRDRIGHELICYARAVIWDEWPKLSDGETSEVATAATDRLIQTLGGLGRSNPGDAALANSLDRMRVLEDARASRILKSDQYLPSMFWVFMIVGGLMLTGYATLLAGNERRLGQVIYILPVSLLLLCSVYLVGVFEQPFRGPNALEPTAMEVALDSTTSFVPDPRANRPCP